MYNIAVVDDEECVYAELNGYLARFSASENVAFNIVWYRDALEFLDGVSSADIVFMDIEMPHLNGMDAAKRLREKDANVPLVFITNMAQYAIKGYEVDAVDYVLKPINYARFSSLLKKILRIMGERADVRLPLKTSDGVRNIYSSSIIYVDVRDHLLVYHTEDGDFDVWATLRDTEKLLPESFARCNHANIVNLKYVAQVVKDTVYLNSGKTLAISRSKHKEFVARLNKYLGVK